MESGYRQKVEELPLPAKLIRGNKVQNLRALPIILNGYNIKLSEAVPKVFQYELRFWATDGKGKEKDLSRGQQNDVSNIRRHEFLYDLFKLLLKEYPKDMRIVSKTDTCGYAYDCGAMMFSVNKLLNVGEEKRFVFDLNTLPEKIRDYVGSRIQKLEGVLNATSEIDLRSTTAISQNLRERDRSVVQFLEVLSSQHLYEKTSHYVFRQKLFEKQSRIPIQNDPRVIIKSGMQKNVRFVGDTVERAHPFLQIDPKKTAFYEEMELITHLCELYRCNNPRELENRFKNRESLAQIAKELKGLVVKTSHLERSSSFAVYNVTQSDSTQISFQMRDGQEMSVAEYYLKKYERRLNYPHFPCIVEKRVTTVEGKNMARESYYPMEVLIVHPGQRLTRQKMTPKLTEEMIRNCQLKPAAYRQENEKQRAQANLSSDEPHFKAFGIRVDPNIRAAGGEVLFPPAIKYANETVNLPLRDRDGDDDVAWQVNRKRFLKGSQVKVWVAVLFRRGIHPNVCTQFVRELMDNARQLGMELPEPSKYDEVDNTDMEKCRQKMSTYKSNGAQLVFFFTKDKLDPVHHSMKLLETEFGIPTQHVSSATVLKATSGRGAQLVYGNILQKMNLKLGGINHDILTAPAWQQKNNTRDDVLKDIWLKNSRMFIGIEMSHASPQSLFERQTGMPPSEPTVVGMAYTVGQGVVAMRGTCWYQTPRETVIEKLDDRIATAILNYHKHCGKFPEHLFVYRSGANEGEIGRVVTLEKPMFHTAFAKVASVHKEFKTPNLTIVAVQRGSNYRVIPQRIDDRANPVKQNCPSGTVVDREVTNPSQTEFIMVSQKAIQGTAQPIKCNVVYDDCAKRLTLEGFEYITYALSFAHGIVTSPVSVPAPLYSADDLAKRGRNNWKEQNFGSDYGSVASGGDRRGGASAADPDYFIKLSDTLKPIINTKFWA